MTGFSGRTFPTEEEHATYLRRGPVRYARKHLDPADTHCSVCGEEGATGNQLQASHRIPFRKGWQIYRLTPDWLDRAENLRWAHSKVCNKAVELSPWEIEEIVAGLPRD